MKESLFDIFQRHRDCYDFRKEPTYEAQKAKPEARQLTAERFMERKQAANEYASSLIPLGNDWIEAVKYDVKQLTELLPPSLHFNKAEREAYRDGVKAFLHYVAEALKEYGKEKFLNADYFDPVTLYRFEILLGCELPLTGLEQDEAEQMVKDMMRQYSKVYCFPDLFSMFPVTYTVLGYKAKASTSKQMQNNAHRGTNGKGVGSNATAGNETPTGANNKPGRPKKEYLDQVIADQQKYAKVEAKLQTMITDKQAVAIIPHLWALADKAVGVFKQIPSFGQLKNRFTIATTTPQGYNEQIRKFVSDPTAMAEKGDPLKKMYLDLINAEK